MKPLPQRLGNPKVICIGSRECDANSDGCDDHVVIACHCKGEKVKR